MTQSNTAAVVAVVGVVFSYFGIPGITSEDLQGFMHVVTGFMALVGIAWAHVSHKKELGRALAGLV